MNIEETLPEGWVWTAIKEVAETASGGTPSRSHPEYYEGTIPWVKSGELKDTVINRTEEFISDQGIQNSNAKLFSKGTALVAMYGATTGQTGILGIDATTNQAICALIPKGKIFLAAYMIYWLQYQRQELINKSAGGAQPNINQEIIRSFPFPLAPLPEQHRIVAAIEQQFTRLDDAIVSLKSAKEKTKQYRASLLKSAVEGELTKAWRAEHPVEETGEQLLERILKKRRERWEEEQLAKMREKGKLQLDDSWKQKYKEPQKPNIENLPELPEGWCWANLSQIADFQNGRPFSSKEYTSTGIKLLRPGNLYADGSVQWTEANTRYLPEIWAERNQDLIVLGHELVMNLTAQSLKDDFLGRICITKANERCLLNQRLARIKPFTEISPYYILYMLKSAIFRRFVDGLNTGSLIQHMFTSQLDNFSFPLPPLAEQAQIVAEVEARLSGIEQTELTIEHSLKRAEHEWQSILREAFAGRLVPQDPEDEPAGVLLDRIREELKKREEAEKVTRTSRKGGFMEKRRKARKTAHGEQNLGLYEKLVEAEQPLSPEELFKKVDLKADNQQESTGTFYQELQVEEKEGLIEEFRPDEAHILLVAREATEENPSEDEEAEIPVQVLPEQGEEAPETTPRVESAHTPTLWDFE